MVSHLTGTPPCATGVAWSKRKCGNLVAARRGFTWICPNVIIAKFGLHSKEKHFGERQRRDAECAEIRREERVGDGVHAVKAAARPPHSMKGGQPEMAVPHVMQELQSIWTGGPGAGPASCSRRAPTALARSYMRL